MTAPHARGETPSSGAGVVVLRHLGPLRRQIEAWRREGLVIGLVPTMGALHRGHGALMAEALAACDRVVVSLFVNPTQFAPHEDFSAYPRKEADDLRFLEGVGVTALYAPDAETMYPEGFATTVTVSGGLTEGLCGAHRPGHFAGVATVVAKLLNQVRPDRAYFGEKDYQQLCVVRRMVRDLDLDVTVEGVAIVREGDGLALSSRNAYLGPAERAIAPELYATLRETARAIEGGEGVNEATAAAARRLLEAGFNGVDYVACVDAETLAPLAKIGVRPARLLAAARLGGCRLIDNLPVAARP